MEDISSTSHNRAIVTAGREPPAGLSEIRAGNPSDLPLRKSSIRMGA